MAVALGYPGLAVSAVISFIVLRAFYRVTLHPLAKFPGPKLAAISSLYQAWYDLRSGTSYIFKFAELHEKYGMAPEGYCILEAAKMSRSHRSDNTESASCLRHYCLQ